LGDLFDLHVLALVCGDAMSQIAVEYVQQTPEGGWRLAGSRVSLDSIVHAYWEGLSPEAIAEDFDTLTVEQIYGALAFYLRNRTQVDAYLANQGVRWESLRATSALIHKRLIERMREGTRKTSELG
jgi:uncharacterized protein (DUF433 family)